MTVPKVITFITRRGQRCYYVAYGELVYPPDVQAQLEALGAREAWRHLRATRQDVAGAAASECEPVRQPRDSTPGRLHFA